MRVFFIGGTGFIGPHVVRRLDASGHEVALFHRGRTTADLPASVGHILGDRHDASHLQRALTEAQPDVVLDMLAMTEAEAEGLMAAARGRSGRLVVVSSGDVYRAYDRLRGAAPGPPDAAPLTEDAPLRDRLYPYRGDVPRADDDPGRWLDDYDKLLVERAVMGDPALPGTVLRLPMVYGPGDRQHRLFPYVKRMADRRPAILLDERLAAAVFPRGYVEDVAAAVALAVTDPRAAGRVYNVAEQPAVPETSWVRRIGKVLGWEGEIVALPPERLPEQLRSPLDPNQPFSMDSTRIRQELGYREVVPTDEALRRTIAWELAHPPEPLDVQQFDYAAEDTTLATR